MLFIKGVIIGIGKILPGVSGSMLAISMGVYEKIINAINNLFKDFNKNSVFLFKISLGILFSIILLSRLILSVINYDYSACIFFFAGLIIGSINEVKKEVSSNNLLIILFFFIIMLILGSISINNSFKTENEVFNFLYYMLVGFIDAITMVIPGISGTAVLMIIGAYEKILYCFSNILNINCFVILIPFFIGLLLGTIMTVKLVSYLFKNYKSKTFAAIYGITLSTIIIMLKNGILNCNNYVDIILCLFLLSLGYFISKKINSHFCNN